MKNPVTEVIFRKFKNGNKEIIALFPYITERTFGTCESYMHIGQHGTADYNHIMNITKPVRPAEYMDLKTELENYGPKEANYNLKVLVRMSWKRYQINHAKQNNLN